MYKHIYVPVDNSDHSNRAIDLAVELGRGFGARLTGCHVYAARLHDYRFKQMEYTLPEEYKDETELERQRKIHDSLIAMGLQLISESYLDVMKSKAEAAGLAFTPKMMDGKHYKALIEDCAASDYDLVVMGALGMGAVKDSQLGSVTERFVRRVTRDTLIVRNHDALRDAQGAIVVGLDGSPQSFHGLRLGLALGRAVNRPVQAVAVYDPYLHYAMFNGIVGVLNEKASKIFRFKEQEQLHEEIIDTGLAKIYQSHLEIARKLAADDGVDLSITLLDGKCFEKILTFARKEQPWLLILGRVGVHSDEHEVDLGSNTENLLRLAPCNVLLTNGRFYPPLDVKAEEIISWTEEAEARMERVPPQVKGVARTALLRYAIEQGHTVITNKVIDEAMAIFMPTRMAEKMQILAEDLAVAQLRKDAQAATAICSICGYTVKGPSAVVTCPVCSASADKFQTITREVVETIAAQEGGIEEEESMPGVQVKWSADARDALREVADAYLRRRAKARVEKYARSRKIPVITCQLALPMIEETVGRDKLGAGWDTLLAKTRFEPAAAPTAAAAPAGAAAPSPFAWTEDAVARLDRVPAGFMRDMTREEIERVAAERGVTTIDLAVCEDGIGHARQTMNEVIAGYVSNKKPRHHGRAISLRSESMSPSTSPFSSTPPASPASPYTAYSVSWNLTQRCNLECAHCYMSAHAGADTRGELSTEECRRVIDEIARVNPNVFLILTGGEPLLRRDIFEVAGYASAKGFTTVLGTNGVLLREREAQRMRESGVLGASISLDSTDRVKHDGFRRLPGSWDGAVRATRVLTDAGLDFSLHMSVTDWNVAEVPAMIDLARTLGAKVLNFFFLVRTGRGKDLTDIDAVAYERILAYLARAQGVGQGPPSFVRRMLGMAGSGGGDRFEDPWSTPVGQADGLLIRAKCAPHFRRILWEMNPSSPLLRNYAHGSCPAGKYYCRITPGGDVTPCPYMPVAVGNLRETAFDALWKTAPVFEALRDPQLGGRCGACEFSRVCGGCRCRAYATSGDYLAEDPACGYQPGAHGGAVIELPATLTFGVPVDYQLTWEPAARERLQAIPSFARGMVVKAVEAYARGRGEHVITAAILAEVRSTWGGRFRPQA